MDLWLQFSISHDLCLAVHSTADPALGWYHGTNQILSRWRAQDRLLGVKGCSLVILVRGDEFWISQSKGSSKAVLLTFPLGLLHWCLVGLWAGNWSQGRCCGIRAAWGCLSALDGSQGLPLSFSSFVSSSGWKFLTAVTLPNSLLIPAQYWGHFFLKPLSLLWGQVLPQLVCRTVGIV